MKKEDLGEIILNGSKVRKADLAARVNCCHHPN